MSITVRRWTEQELKAIDENTDKWLITVFMNVKSFGKNEIGHYPYHARKVYIVSLDDDTIETVYATDDAMAIQFAHAEYDLNHIQSIREMIITYRKLDV